MSAYYNELDPFAAAWLRNLIRGGYIAPGDVDERSITEVQQDDLKGYTQCHFFAGIGGWSYALRLARWPDERPVWTGSCPCQPYSSLGEGRAQQDERHLWPYWFRLIREQNPSIIFGEQVEDAIAYGWMDDAFSDLEAANYACAAAILPAYSVERNHERNRIFFISNSNIQRLQGWQPERQRFGAEKLPKAEIWRDIPTPYVCSAADGIPNRVGKLRGFGNAIIPQVAAEFINAAAEAIA